MQPRRLTKLFSKKRTCEFCNLRLSQQEKKVGFKISRKQYLCLKCALENKFITDQEIIKFVKSKIPEIRISYREENNMRVRY